MSLKDEILGEMIKADNNGTIHSSNYGMLAEIILSLVEKRIDERIKSLSPHNLDAIIFERIEELKVVKELLK